MSAKHIVILPAIGLLLLTLALSGCRAAPNQSVLDQQGQTQTEATQAGHPDNTPGEADDQPIAGASQLSLAGISLGTAVETVQERLGLPSETVDPGHPRNPATVLYRYPGLDVLIHKDLGSVLSVKATKDWPGPIIGDIRWGDSLSEVRAKLQALGEPIQGDKGPITLTFTSPDKSHGITLVFDENDHQLTKAELDRQIPGSDYQGV